MDENMVKYWRRFDDLEQQILCHMLRQWGITPGCQQATKASLHLLSVKSVTDTLWRIGYESPRCDQRYKRKAKEYLVKLQDAYNHNASATETFIIHLNSVKVHRVFGAHPERGKPLSILPKVKVTVGKK